MAEHLPRIAPGAGWVSPSDLPKGPNGRALCRRCSTEVAPPRRTFCSESCVTEWKIRTDPGFAKKKVWERDNGICAECRSDTLGPARRAKIAVSTRLNWGIKLSPWDMDHIVPVVEGGGACGLENLRTLCKPCHRSVTAALARRRAERRKASVVSA